jgi:hypothetical protein
MLDNQFDLHDFISTLYFKPLSFMALLLFMVEERPDSHGDLDPRSTSLALGGD